MSKRKSLTVIALILIFTFILSGCGGRAPSLPTDKAPQFNSKYAEALAKAKKIVIKENLISLGKKYTLYVDGKEVGTVTGKLINAFGDVFILKDKAGNVLSREKQIKRWHIKFNRTAVITDSNDKITGYIGEQTLTKIFSIGYFFQFYDKDKNELGTSDQVNFSLFKKNIFKNKDGAVAYKVNKNLTFLKDSYDLNVLDSSKISLYQAVFMVCIEDAIKDAKEKDAQKKSKKKKR